MERLRCTDIKFLKGVGPKRAELLNKQLGIKIAPICCGITPRTTQTGPRHTALPIFPATCRLFRSKACSYLLPLTEKVQE